MTIRRGGRTAPSHSEGYRIEKNNEAIGGRTITCLKCGFTSYHPQDVLNRYCGQCGQFHK